MIKAVIFDCFGVLTTDSWKAFVDNLPKKVDREQLSELNRIYDSSGMSLDEFLKKVHDLTGQQPPLVEKFLDNEIVKNTQLFEYIGTLKNRGYQIGLLSNIATNWIVDYFLTDEEKKLFDSMTFSFQEKVAKPDPRIFQIACKRLNAGPSEVIMVDDSYRHSEAAEKLGMNSILYKNFSDFKPELENALSTAR